MSAAHSATPKWFSTATNAPHHDAKGRTAERAVHLRFQTPASHSDLPAISSWSSDRVYEWALSDLRIKAEDAERLKEKDIDGKTLVMMTKQALMQCGIEVVAATKLVLGIEACRLQEQELRKPGMYFRLIGLVISHTCVLACICFH